MVKKYAIHGLSENQLLGDYQGVQLVATSELPKEQRIRLSQKFPKLKHYDGMDEMLQHEKLDMVSICGDQSFKNIKSANHKKLVVLAEKPLVQQEEELKEIVRLNDEAPIYTMMPMFYHPCLQIIREIITSGEIGQVVQVICEKSYTANPGQKQKDRLQNLISCLQWALVMDCGEAELLLAVDNNLGSSPEDTAMSVQMKLANGALFSIAINSHGELNGEDWCKDRIRIWGTEGVVDSCNLSSLKVMTKKGEVREENGFDALASSAFPQQLFDAFNRGTSCEMTPEMGFWASEMALKIARFL